MTKTQIALGVGIMALGFYIFKNKEEKNNEEETSNEEEEVLKLSNPRKIKSIGDTWKKIKNSSDNKISISFDGHKKKKSSKKVKNKKHEVKKELQLLSSNNAIENLLLKRIKKNQKRALA